MRKSLRRRCVQAEASGTACNEGDFSLQREEGGEIFQNCFGHFMMLFAAGVLSRSVYFLLST